MRMRSLEWLAARLPEAGLAATIDGIGNVFGSSAKPGPKLLAGSHLESQNYAGWLDHRSASSMRAEMLFQIRDDDLAVIARLEERLRRMAADISAQGRVNVAIGHALCAVDRGVRVHWSENTADADIVTEVLVETCRLVLERASAKPS